MENPLFCYKQNVKFSVYPNLYKFLATSFLHLLKEIVAK